MTSFAQDFRAFIEALDVVWYISDHDNRNTKVPFD